MGRWTRVLLILICFELGALLLFLPWTLAWERNYFLNRYPALIPVVLHPALRGAISALGLLNILIAAEMILRRSNSHVAKSG